VCAFAKRGPRSSVSVATQWSHERIGEKILILAEKAAVDCGFDLEPRRYGRVICFTSTRHPAAVYLRLADDATNDAQEAVRFVVATTTQFFDTGFINHRLHFGPPVSTPSTISSPCSRRSRWPGNLNRRPWVRGSATGRRRHRRMC